MMELVDYLGRRIDAQGVHAAPSKVEGVMHVHELRSFLGMINYLWLIPGKLIHFAAPCERAAEGRSEVAW